MPYIVHRIVEPEIGEVFRCLTCVLEPPKQHHILFIVRHSMPGPRRRRLALRALNPRPFPSTRFKAVKIVVVIKGPLLRGRELPAEKIDSFIVCVDRPCVT